MSHAPVDPVAPTADDPVQPAAAGPEPGERPPAEPAGSEQALIEADLLVEDVSIDGMCGVY